MCSILRVPVGPSADLLCSWEVLQEGLASSSEGQSWGRKCPSELHSFGVMVCLMLKCKCPGKGSTRNPLTHLRRWSLHGQEGLDRSWPLWYTFSYKVSSFSFQNPFLKGMQILNILGVEDTPLTLNEDRDSEGQQMLQAGPVLFIKVLKGVELFTETVCKCSGLIFRYPRERKGQTIHDTI